MPLNPVAKTAEVEEVAAHHRAHHIAVFEVLHADGTDGLVGHTGLRITKLGAQVGEYRLSRAPQYLLPRHPTLGKCHSYSRVRVLVHELNAGANGGFIHRSLESFGLHQVMYLQQKESQRMRERKAVCEKGCVCNSEEIQRESKRMIVGREREREEVCEKGCVCNSEEIQRESKLMIVGRERERKCVKKGVCVIVRKLC